MSNHQIFKKKEAGTKELYWFIIRDTLLNKDKYYPDPNWWKGFLEREAEGWYNEGDDEELEIMKREK